jgi:hypothetical protein
MSGHGIRSILSRRRIADAWKRTCSEQQGIANGYPGPGLMVLKALIYLVETSGFEPPTS